MFHSDSLFVLAIDVLLFIQVLDNGILVDPHNQNDIAEALYRLVSDKQLWAKCRQNGLDNIHRFSWPEHCKNYLSRVGTLKSRHPHGKRVMMLLKFLYLIHLVTL